MYTASEARKAVDAYKEARAKAAEVAAQEEAEEILDAIKEAAESGRNSYSTGYGTPEVPNVLRRLGFEVKYVRDNIVVSW